MVSEVDRAATKARARFAFARSRAIVTFSFAIPELLPQDGKSTALGEGPSPKVGGK